MAEPKIEAGVIVTARVAAANLARKINGSVDFQTAQRYYDWIMAPADKVAEERRVADNERMAKARAAKKAGDEDKMRAAAEETKRLQETERQRMMQSHPATLARLANG